MSVIKAFKRGFVRQAIKPTAKAFDTLADHLIELPEHTVFTRDDVIRLLRDVAQKMRTAEIP